MTEMNKERLKMVRDRIDKEPEANFIMSDYHCGTAHCIAGWAEFIATKGKIPPIGQRTSIFSMNWLGLTEDQRMHLFDPDELYDTSLPATGSLGKTDALHALDSLINAENDAALPVWPRD